MANNGGVLTIISTEGGLFDILNGKYSNTVSIDTVLKAYSCEPIRVDRKGSENETVDSPALTMLLSAQENVLEGLLSNEVFRNRGLTGRILYCKPASKMGSRPFQTPAIPEGLEEAYHQLLLDLLNIPRPKTKRIIKLDFAATALLEHFHKWLEPKLIKDLEEISDWAGRLLMECSRNQPSARCRNPPDSRHKPCPNPAR